MAGGGPERRAWSSVVFNNKHLLDVALWIDSNATELITVRRIAAALELGDGTVRPVVERLEKMGLVVRIRGIEQAVPIEPQKSDLWQVLIDVAAMAPKPAKKSRGTNAR